MRTPSSDGVLVAVHDLGGDGPPILLTHATGFHGLAYPGLAVRLAERFRVWSLDFRAHGDSTRPAAGNLDWRGMADDALAVVDALGLDRPFAFGHSLGGGALVLAEAARPGAFRALYLYEPATMNVGVPDEDNMDGDNIMVTLARRRRPVFGSRDAAFANYAGKPPLDELSPASLRAYVDHGFADRADGTVELKCRPEDEAETFSSAYSGRAFDALALVGCPVTVARGAIDTPGPGNNAPVVAAELPHGRLEVLAGLAHFGPQADPDMVARSVIEALLGG